MIKIKRVFKMGENENEKIDWTEKFRQFAYVYAKDDFGLELMTKYFSLAKRKSGEITPSEFEQIYKQIYKSDVGES